MNFKNMILKGLAVIGTVFLSHFIYSKIYWEPELKDQGYMLFNLREFQWHNDVLYLGESSNYWVSPNDTDKRTISDMINDSIDGMRLSGMQVPAYHAGMFLPIIDLIDTSARVKKLVVTMNLRSFGKPWIYSPQESALLRTKCFYQNASPLYNRLCATLGFHASPSADEQDKKMLHCFEFDTLKVNFELPHNTIKTWCEQEKFPLPEGGEDFPKRVLADHYIKGYAFQIDVNNNPRIHDFDKIAEICKQKNIQLYFNILAENVEWADSLVGPSLVYFMKTNRDLLVKRYSEKGVIMIDNLEKVPGQYFGEKDWTTEHYTQEGRMIVAQNVAKTLMLYFNQ
ncbi:MAG: hypothetical protein Q8K70_11580 [Bacteroidota bacterium]|nr:hypothetical protein [Bacteroidota bacterium]